MDGERTTCISARKHQTGTDIRINSDSFEVFWTFGETGPGNGEWCDAWGSEWNEKARKTKNKVARHTIKCPTIHTMRWDTRERQTKWRNDIESESELIVFYPSSGRTNNRLLYSV